MFGGVEIREGDSQRDWRCCAAYLARKMKECFSRYTAAHPETKITVPNFDSHFHTELPFVGDLVPIRKLLLTAEDRVNQRKANELKRISGIVTLAVDGVGGGHDLLTDLRTHLPEFAVSDVINPSSFLLQLENDNQFSSFVHLPFLRAELKKCATHDSISIAVTPTSFGIRLDLTGGDRGSVMNTASNINTRCATWRIPLMHPLQVGSVPSTVSVQVMESLIGLKGSASSYKRWKAVLRRHREQPQLTYSIRIVNCKSD